MVKLILKMLLGLNLLNEGDELVSKLRDENYSAKVNIISYITLLLLLFILSATDSMNNLITYGMLLVLAPGIVIAGIRLLFVNGKIQKDNSDNSKSAYLIKKYNYVDLNKYKVAFSLISYIFAFGFFILVWNYKEYEEIIENTIAGWEDFEDVEHEAPVTQHQPPPLPPPVIEIKTVPEEEIIEEEIEIEELEMDEEEEVEEIIEEAPEEEEEEVFMIVEDMPEFASGGQAGMMKYLAKNIKYPNIAQDNGIQGTVMVQFVVKKDGSISEARVIRGIGAGCDEEALRVIKQMPNWKPGKQRGRAVPVRCMIPVRFKLS